MEGRGRGRPGTRALRFVDEFWDVLLVSLVGFGLLAAAALLAWLVPSVLVVAYVLILIALVVVLVAMTSVVVLQGYRLLSGGRRLNETAIGQVRDDNWTVILCHVRRPNQVDEVFAAARALIRQGDQNQALLYLERGITKRRTRERVQSGDMVQRLADVPPVFVYSALTDRPLSVAAGRGRFVGRDLALVFGGTVVFILVLATLVPQAELASCPIADCPDQPTRFADALYWLASRLLGGDPEGVGVVNPWSRAIGLLLSFYGVVVLIGIVERVIQQRIDETVASGPALVSAFNQRQAERVNQLALSQRPVVGRAGRVRRWLLRILTP